MNAPGRWILCVALGALLVVPASAGAGDSAGTRVRITAYEFKFDRFSVLVRSGEKRCERHRKVTVWKLFGPKPERIGSARTDHKAAGGWIAIVDAFPASTGTYIAKAKRTVVHRHGKPVVCKRERSPGFLLTDP